MGLKQANGNSLNYQLAEGMERIHGVSDGNINISDVIEVIQTTDPEFVECNGEERDVVTMFSGGGVEAMGTGSIGPGTSRKTAYVKILEQPASKALRFRYECEGRSAGSIPGVNSTPENKTFPSIRIEGYKGRAVVVVSCVTKDPPYRPHPHNLVGKEACRRGVCTVEIASESMTVTFANLGIQCVKKKDIEEALRVREEIRVDPYRTGFSHRGQPTSIDLNAVRLCFQVFLEGAEKGKFSVPLSPVVSDPIYDKKAMSDLVICKLSDCTSTVAGGKEMILLCEKVAKEDIQVRFFEERDGQLVWEDCADFQPTHVHKQVAISFRTPRYRVLEVDQPVKVLVQLRRPSDGATSDPLPFELLPLDSDPKTKRKRKYANDPSAHVLRHLQAEADKHGTMQYQPLGYGLNPIKAEPIERGPSPYQMASSSGMPAGGFSPVYRVDRATPSPQPGATLQPFGQQLSPGRTPSPLDYGAAAGPTQYNISPTHLHHQQLQQQQQQQQQQQHQQQQQQQIQQQQQQQHHQFNVPPQFQTAQHHQYMLQQQMMLNRVTTPQTGSDFLLLDTPGIHNPITENMEGVGSISSMLNLDSRQSSFELNNLNILNSADLATLTVYDDNLLQTLSSNLSLSENRVSQVTAESGPTTGAEAAVGNGNNMTDSFNRLTTSTIQDICTLNNMYNPTRDNTD